VDGVHVALAATQDGVIHAVWSDNTFGGSQHQIVYSQKPLGGAWSTPVVVWNGSEEADCAKIAPGPSNSIHVAWVEQGSGTLRYRARGADGAWAPDPPDIVETGVSRILCTESITVGGDGTVHAVWHSFYIDKYRVRYSSRAPSGQWLPPETLRAAELARDWGQAVAVTPDGTVHVVWADGYHPTLLMYSSKVQGGVWTEPLSIAPTLPWFRGFDVLAGSDGRVHVATGANMWSSADIFYLVRGADGTWSTPVNASNNPPSSGPSMAWVGQWQDQGCIGLVWNRYATPREVWYNRLCPSGSWSAPYRIAEPGSYDRSSPRIASVPGVVDVVAWTEGPVGGQDVVYVERYASAVGGIAELPDIAPGSVEASHSSRGDAGLLVALVATAAAGAMTVVAGAWYARRRWLR